MGQDESNPSLPFVETSIARLMQSRLAITHQQRAISVISGPWGIGKTWAIDRFVRDQEYGCAVVKIEPGTSKKGVSQITAMQFVYEAMGRLGAANGFPIAKRGYWNARGALFDALSYYASETWDVDGDRRFTFIFDEAQYLSREAIEMLRFWNDVDRHSLPFPVGLVFVGNNEFALQEDAQGESVISGAVRSRLLFQEQLQYANIGDLDLTMFLQSRGVTDPAAIEEVLYYFSQPGRRRDLRYADRQVALLKTLAGDDAVTGDLVRGILNVG